MFTFKSITHTSLAIWRDFTAKRVLASASRLTYSTLLATVPILAVVFAIARGFGYSIYIEEWFRQLLQAQPDAGEIIIGFVNSYLINTKKGLFLGIGLLFMLWTVLMLIINIEETFNDIWLVKRPRSLFRTCTDYLALLFCVPIIVVISSGLNIWVSAINRHIVEIAFIGPLMKFLIELTPFVLMSAAFIALYVFMPNTKVRIRSALIPGIIAGIAMQLFQYLYINSQIWVSNYNAIYGSFAILPLFMLWMQISWTIILIGAELTYATQNREDFHSAITQEKISHNTRMEYAASIMAIICKRFKSGEEAYTLMQLKELTGISTRTLTKIIYELQQIHFVSETAHDEKGEESRFQPAESLENISIGELEYRLNRLGANPQNDTLAESEVWKSAILLQKEHINTARNIKLSDL